MSKVITQQEFAELLGISEGSVSQLKTNGIIKAGATGTQWLRQYVGRLREQAAGRASDGHLDLVQERAALAKEQRVGLEIKNAVLRGEYASVALLAEVLANASQSVAERFDHLPGLLRKVCPDMPEADRDQIITAIANARNEWARATVELVQQAMGEVEEEEPQEAWDAGAD